MQAAEDTILFGKYQVCRVLGTGQRGTVYKARHVLLGQYRAIKQVPVSREQGKDEESEVRILKNLKHPGIPMIYDIFRSEGELFIVEEYLEGESLFALISERGSLSKAETISYGIELCRIINYLHHSADDPILHLDLQPKNILLCHDGLKLIDFDQAVIMRGQYSPEKRYGTPGCAAPEQFKKEPLDERTDIYAIGALLFYMRKGMFPGAGAVCGEEKGLAAVIGKCLREDRKERYGSVEALLSDLISLKNGSFPELSHSSLTIAVAGSRSGMGATHASLGLAAYLAERGISVLYEEKNDSGAVWQMADVFGVSPDVHGIVHLRRWHLRPFYGPTICVDAEKDTEYPVRIRDYGGQWKQAAEDAEADRNCLILGARCWELSQACRAAEGFSGKTPAVYIVNHLGSGRISRALRRAIPGGAPVFRMPFFEDTEKPGKAAGSFFEELFRELMGKEEARPWPFLKGARGRAGRRRM